MFIRFVAIIFALSLGACSPVFNWRDVPFEATGSVVLLPCKPNRAQRLVPLLGQSEQVLSMAGCEAGGASFSVSVVQLPLGTTDSDARMALARWQQAHEATLKSRAGLTSGIALRGASAAQLVVTKLEGEAAMANKSQTQSRSVFALQLAPRSSSSSSSSAGPVLMHAQLLGEPEGGRDGPSALSAQAADTFIAGLNL